MTTEKIKALPVQDLAAKDAVLLLWISWPMLQQAMEVIHAWGFTYKTCAFDWMKAHAGEPPLMGLGYWTRANTEACLLATKGHPKRLSGAVRMAILEAPREHSRKPDCVHDRVERLAAGPYVELFSRHQRNGWDFWGNESTKFR